MMSTVRVLGLDPGFANLGWGVIEIGTDAPRALACGVITTEKSAKKRTVLAADDNVRRARELTAALSSIIFSYGVKIVAAESMSFPRNSSAAAKMAISWGAISALAHMDDLPILQASPQEIKRVVCGDKTASKEDVQREVERRCPNLPELLSSIKKSLHEHACDALAASITVIETSDSIRIMRNTLSQY